MKEKTLLRRNGRNAFLSRGWAVVLLFIMLTTQVMAQITVTIQNKSIKVALTEIEKVSKYKFFYNEGLKGLTNVVSIKMNNATIDQTMQTLLKGTEITYKKETNNLIVLTELKKDLPKKIAGRILDESSFPVVGATIVTDNGKGTTSNAKGEFSLNCDGASSFTVSYIGYKSVMLPIGTKTNYDITLQEDKTVLEEVVIIGYGSTKRKDVTTAVSTVSTKDIQERPITSAAQAIAGKAAGVQVIQPSGAPGSALSIRVRGATSIQASNEPLYVVDGVPMDDISNLSPNDIESMQILKDASSAAIYGARAANGVVLITTKRGAEGRATVKVSSYIGFSEIGKTIDALNTEQYKDLMRDLRQVTVTVPEIPASETRYTNWTNEFFKTGVDQNYQVSLMNGNDKIQYYLSAGYTDQTGIVRKAGLNRYNVRANIDSQQTKWLKIGLSTAYTHSKINKVYESRSAMRAGSILSVINTPPFMQIWDAKNPGQYDEEAYGSRIMNPIAANATDQSSTVDRLVTALNFNFKLSKAFSFKTNLALDIMNARSDKYLDPLSTNDGRSTKGYVAEGHDKNADYLMENILTYDQTFGDHTVSALVGSTVESARAEWSHVAGFDLLTSYPNITGIAGANQIKTDETNGGNGAWSLASFIGRVAYNYQSKYLLTVNMRADGSSKFAPGKRWGYFPSVSAGWRLSSEPFMKWSHSALDDLKIRIGWGKTGNQGGIGNYSYLAQYSAERVPPTTDNQLPGYALTPYSAANPNLTWESTTQTNIGIDASFFNSRLNFSADFYYKKTNDLLLTVYLPSSVNLPGGITRNDGEMTNKGMEFLINSANIRKNDFSWNTDFNISFNKNKIDKLGLNKIYYYGSMYTTGQNAILVTENVALGSFFGYISEGVDPETGDIVYRDLNGNTILDPNDRAIIGCAQPKFTFGMTNTFNWKGLGFSFFLQGSYGNDIFNASKIDMEQMLDFRNQSTTVLRRWRRPGQITDIPRVGNVANINNSTRFVEDGSYLRLKSVTLSYDLQSKFLKKLNISKVQPYITAQNLFTLTKYTGYDPEVNAYGTSGVQLGIDYGTYPQCRTFVFGLNIEF